MRVLLLAALAAVISAAADAQPREFRDCANCPAMIAIPPGGFLMGSPLSEVVAEGVPTQYHGEGLPQTRINFAQGFALGKFPVTRTEYWAFLSATNHPRAGPCWGLTIQSNGGGKFEERSDLNWQSPGFDQTANDPSVCVSWDDAQAYVAWLSQRTGKRYRLPSEAEWEYTARGGTPGPRWWPGGRESACGYANVRDYSFVGAYNFKRDENVFPCSDGYAHTSPVDAFPANPFGLYDALGNVAVWTQDCWNPDLKTIPRNGAARTTGDCTLRVARGASWFIIPWDARAGRRSWVTTGLRSTTLGFRVARTN